MSVRGAMCFGFRAMPPSRNFVVFCGLRNVLEHAVAVRFDPEDMRALDRNPLLGPALTVRPMLRGAAVPGLQGAYLYADFVSGRLWGLFKTAAGVFELKLLSETGLSVSSFGEGADGEVFVLDYGTGGIFKITGP